MSLEQMFPATPLTQTEEDLLKEVFSSVVVKRYLQRLALEDTKELLLLSATASDDSLIIKAHSTVQGRLQVIGTLLSIGASPQTNQPTN